MVICDLCGLSTAHPITNDAGQNFCCPACCEVAALLQEEKPVTTAVLSDTAVATATITLNLSGLWCSSCAWLVGEQLRRADGVAAAETSFIQRQSHIHYDPHRTNPRRLAKVVRRLGYRASLPGEKPHDEEEAHWMRLLISGVAAMHVMILSFMLYWREWTGRATPETAWLADFFQLMIMVMAVPVVLIIGLPILRAGMVSLLRGRPNTHTLIAIGAFAAFGLSLRNFIVGSGGVYFDTAAVLLFLLALGRWFEMRAQKVSTQAVERLWQQVPAEAVWLSPDGEKRIPADEVRPGARLLVRPGERFAVDGLIAAGQGDVDESLLTGEPEPVARQVGERVLAGTVSLDGAFEVVTTAVGSNTVVGQIGRLLHQAMWQRAPIERLADKVAAWMVPLAVLLSGGTFIFWSQRVGVEAGLVYALSVLLIACPCALGIATPLTLWLGLGRATEAGMVLRQTAVLERLASVQHVFFDKTGTITKRPLRLQGVAVGAVLEQEFLGLVTAVEARSEHPLAQAIVEGVKELTIDNCQLSIVNWRVMPGLGVMGGVAGTAVFVGSRRLMAQEELVLPEVLAETVVEWQKQGWSVVYGGWGGQVRGLLALGEAVREETAVVLHQLQALGLETAVLTGDDAIAGERWQHTLGIPVYAEQHPEDKVARLQNATGGTLMVGDGLNDGPALAAATVGLTVCQGTDVAQAAADVVLLSDDLAGIPWLVSLARTTMSKVQQNLIWAFAYNAIGLALAVSGHLQPSLAALLMLASNVIVTTNALRLRRIVISSQWSVVSNSTTDHKVPITDYQLPITEHG